MKKGVLTLLTSTLFIISHFSQTITADTCISGGGGGGNIVMFANYDGGVLNINVDQNIPNLKIGVCTYEPVTINLSGPFVGNVTEVRYAGYVSTSNHHCFNSPGTTTITGAPGGATTSVNFLPPSTLSNPNGNGSIVCAYSCSISTNQGGCNTADQIIDYFETSMSGTLYSYYTQYGCWSTTPYNVSAGGNCPFSGAPDTSITRFASSATTICVGETINFTDLSPGASGWTWYAPSSSTPSATSQNLNNVFWTASGSYNVTLSSSNGTSLCSATQVITVLDNPTLNPTANPNPICMGDTSNLFASGASSYQWNPGGPSASSWMVNPAVDTWYHISGTDLNGCSSEDSVLVMVYPAPVDPFLAYTLGLLIATPSGYTFTWYLDGNIIPGVTSDNYLPTVNGMYGVEYADSNGCMSDIAVVPVNDLSGAGIEELESSLIVFPNPSTGVFQLSMPNVNTEVAIEIFDVLGKSIYSKKVWFNQSYMLDLSNERKGSYFIKTTIGNQQRIGKLMIR